MDAAFSPGFFFWLTLFVFSLLLWIFSQSFPINKRRGKWASKKGISLEVPFFGTVFVSLLVGAFFGFWHYSFWNLYPANDLGNLIPSAGSPGIIECWVDESPLYKPAAESTGAGSIFKPTPLTFFRGKAVRILNRGEWQDCSGKIQVMVSGDARFLRLGDRIQIGGYLSHPVGARNPGDYDQAFQLRCYRTLTQMTVNLPESIQILHSEQEIPVRRFFEKIRHQAQTAFEKNLRPQNAALASAMLLGIRDGIDEETMEEIRETGTAHLLAISGLHVALIAGFFYFILLFFRFPYYLNAWILAGAVLFYLILIGMRPPAVRASILIFILCGGLLFKRKPLSVNSFAASGLIILLMNPCHLFQLGVHLSFIATGVFLWFRTPFVDPALRRREDSATLESQQKSLLRLWERQLRWGHPILYRLTIILIRFGQSLLEILIVTFIINLILAPIVLRQMNQLAPISILINPLIWIPLQFSLILGLMIPVISGTVPFLLPIVSSAADFFFDVFRFLLQSAHRVPWGHFSLMAPPLWWTVGFYLPLIFWTLFPALRPRKRRIFLLFLLWGSLGLAGNAFHRAYDQITDRLEIDVVSVGHGGAILIHFPDRRTVLFDCGTFSTPESVARKVKKTLLTKGKTKIDLAIISHADADHYNGISTLMEEIPIQRVVVSPLMFAKKNTGVNRLRQALEEQKIPIYLAEAGTTLAPFGFEKIQILHPHITEDSKEKGSNANSLVAAIHHLGRKIMLPGDLDDKEAPFLQTKPTHFDLMLAPHHGGKSDNYEDLLSWASPWGIIISGGHFQRYPQNEAELRKRGFKVWNTYESGAITIEIRRPIFQRTKQLGELTVTPYCVPTENE